MKKILSLILALLMIASCASFIFAEEAVADDAAVLTAAPAEVNEEDSAYYDAVAFLAKYGIMKGKGEGVYGVYDNIKRYEMALFIGRICTGWVEDAKWEDGTENNSGFIDLEGTAAENYYGAISFVANKGIIEGVGGKKFAPEAGIKYEDALTMAVRALGYKNLAYPWGYIEKAVNLGLTDGISGLAYTETLKREVVAQIIYNALFAETADGTTLGKDNFDISTKYEVAIIAATDGGKFLGGVALADKGYVTYALITADGKVSDNKYSATAATFGFNGEHEDEENLGAAFKIIRDGKGTIISAESLELDPVLNEGLNSKEAGKYPIQAFLGEVTLVSTFAKGLASGKVAIYTKDLSTVVTLTEMYAVDWATGNVLLMNNANYTVAWFYNELLDVYFTYKLNALGEVVGIEYKSREEVFNKLNTVYSFTKEYSDCYGAFAKKDDIKNSAYAELRIFDVNGDEEADYGIYESYRLGKFTAVKPALDVTKLVVGDSYASILSHYNDWFGYSSPSDPDFLETVGFPKFTAASEAYNNNGIDFMDYSEVPNGNAPKSGIGLPLPTVTKDSAGNPVEGCKPGVVSFQNDGATPYGKLVTLSLTLDDVWFEDGAEVPAEGAWVIYGTNPVTNGIKIVETLKEYEEGAETYLATGLLRAYSTKEKTVTIGDEVFSTSYDELKGSTFTSDFYQDHVWYMGSQYLGNLFMQFVDYIVVDGKVVYMEASGVEDNRFLVVDKYAGITKDGYIAINAWDTKDGDNKQIRIANLDGYKFGDLFYYAQNYNYGEEIFSNYTVLQILSYDPTTDSYGVKKLGGFRTDAGNGGKGESWYDPKGFRVDFDWKNHGFGTAYDFKAHTPTPDDAYHTDNKTAYGFYRLNDDMTFRYIAMDFKFIDLGITLYGYAGGFRAADPDLTALADPNYFGYNGNYQVDEANRFYASNTPTSYGKDRLTEDDTYIMIYGPNQIAGSPVRIYKGLVTDSSWYIRGWRLNGTPNNVHVYFGLTAGDVKGFQVDKKVSTNTLVMIPSYLDDNSRRNGSDGTDVYDYGSWYLPDLGMTSGFQLAFGNGSDYMSNAHYQPWGYTITAEYDAENNTLLGSTYYDVTVLNLRTLHTETVHVGNLNMKPNFVYEVRDGVVVGEPHDANELYTLLIGTFGNNSCDLKNDLTELFTTTYNTSTKKASHESSSTYPGKDNIHGEYNSASINFWMTSKYLGYEFADFAPYTIKRKSRYAAACAVYEGEDGHIELTVLGSDGAGQYEITGNGNYGENPVRSDKNGGGNPSNTVQKSVSGSNSDLDIATVTIVNMENVRLQGQLSPYGAGMAAVTYLFAANKLPYGTIDTFAKNADN